MIHIKNDNELAIMRQSGKMLSETLWEVMQSIKPGMTEVAIDSLAERLIKEKGGESGFKKVPGYHHTICACVNDIVVHGIPSEYVLKEGDIICVDCGVFYKGFHTDMAETIVVGGMEKATNEERAFLTAGKEALEKAIAIANPGNRVGHIAKIIQDIVEKEHGYSIVRSLVGHGVGKQLHEPPEVPGFLAGRIENTPELKVGMTIAIEVIYNMGGKQVVIDDDGWTIRTQDGSLSAVYERSVEITKDGAKLLTP